MRRNTSWLVGFALTLLAGVASAKNDPKPKKPPVLRVAHTYADAMAEAKDRNCIVFATFHADG
jgi:hypothetical protein